MDELKVGDVVRLKSGGPRMTVEGINGASHSLAVDVAWFDGLEAKSEAFAYAALVRAEESDDEALRSDHRRAEMVEAVLNAANCVDLARKLYDLPAGSSAYDVVQAARRAGKLDEIAGYAAGFLDAVLRRREGSRGEQ